MRKRAQVLLNTLLCLVVAGQAAADAQQKDGSSAETLSSATVVQEADTLFENNDWAGASKAYEAVVKREPANGRAWFRLGAALHALGLYNGAIDAYQRAITIGPAPHALPAMFRLARVYARMNNKEIAFEWLRKATQAGFSQVQALNTEPDLENLRGEARFQELLIQAQANARPCTRSPQARQFDFWIGEWDVQAGGQAAGTNSVQLILGDCVVFENWSGAGGGSGKSFNFYNATLGKWQQTWVDDRGGVLQFIGEFKDGAMRFQGETLAPKGNKVMHRLTFFPLAADRVRQLWEQSSDGGKTWNVAFDGTYTRKK